MKLNCVLVTLLATITTSSFANIATFDGFSEGLLDYTVTDNGISVYDLHLNLPGSPDPNKFVCEDASNGGLGSGFSSPNALAFVGYVPGPDCAFGRVHSFKMRSEGALSTFGSVEIWTLDFWGGCTVTLNAYNGTTVEATDSFSVVANSINHHTLSVAFDDFEYMELTVTGGSNDNCTFALVDNIQMTPVPEPAAMAALAFGFGAVLLRRKR